MKARTGSRKKDEALLTSVAESIGSALGMIAAKTNAAQKALSRSSAANVVKRGGRRIARKTKAAGRKTSAAVKSVRGSKVAKAARRGVRAARASAKRAARRR